ncbi:hypothetical protein PR048_027727 [Dryococelus australis]|uniref:Uncharacterized protein n=1 Tax=Dryococelus australis TaxID=614101 RepID=A0ABQ9GHA5_9NEOP|nr:hypothetical protein PR048_027727 [Dryococelus australis]
MRVVEVNMARHWNEGAGETGDPREKPADQRHRPHQVNMGPGVAERLARSPPTKANLVHSSAWSPEFRKWESCPTMALVRGFSRGSPIYPAPSFRRRSIFISITPIGSQDLFTILHHVNMEATEVRTNTH